MYKMAFRIRSSKFRHVYGDAHRKEKCYENVRLTRNAHDSNFCAVNPKYLAVVTESAGGGAFVVLPIEKTGRVDINAPKVSGHAGGVLDIKWNPFKDDIIASGSEDNTVKIWQIPNGGLRGNLSEWLIDLHGHGRRVAYIDWHPTADNIILSAGLDYKCIIWNVEQAEPVNVIDCHTDVIQSISWNRDGSLFCTTCKDKIVRVIDPRSASCVAQTEKLPVCTRPMKGLFLGDTGRIFSTGFTSLGARDFFLWDIRNMKSKLTQRNLDASNGIILPYYDHDTKIVFLAGKGDGNIRYYEMVSDSPYEHYLNCYISSSPQRGLGVMPKRGCDPSRCEIMRFYKLHAARNFVEPISMIVPRKSNSFHDDIYPPAASAIPSLSADEWVSGQNRDPILISMKDGALNQAPTITTYKAVSSRSHQEPVAPATRQEPAKTPASLKNIKQLSTSDDIITLVPVKEPESQIEEEKEVEDKEQSEKAFVNRKIAAFENKGSQSDKESATTINRPFRRSWSSVQENPPDVIANGLQANCEKIHVKKTWSPVKAPSTDLWEESQNLPNTDPELRKAYFQQVTEIKALKEQLALKDKRIRQLEDEVTKIRSGDPQGESEC